MLLVVAALALPLGASAKDEITRLRVCGALECRTVADRAAVHAFLVAITNGAQGRDAPPKGAYYTIRPERTGQWQTNWPRYVYVPSIQMIRLQLDHRAAPEWRWLGRRDQAVRRLVHGLKPYARVALRADAR